jgi:mono/diheme cytochrome c family protein
MAVMRTQLAMVAALALAGGCKKKEDKPATPPPTPDKPAEVKPPEPPPGPDPQLVARGKYIADLAGCALCHMPMGEKGPDFSRPFAGGMEAEEKFGTWRAPNITPHKGTGIGGWTDDQILAAIREGLRPDGSQLYPIMAYPYYNRLSDADGKALVTFLRSLPEIENVVEPTKELKLPKPPAPKPSGEAADPADPVKYGEYLASIAHCHMCHTPMTDKGPDMAKSFAGGFEFEMPPQFGTGILYSTNITSDPDTGIGKWTQEQIAAAIKTMRRPDGTPILGPMMLYQMGWSQLTDADVNAIAAYVKQLPPIKQKNKKSTFKPNPAMMGALTGEPPPGGPPPGDAK